MKTESKNSNTGLKYIYKVKSDRYKQGFFYTFHFRGKAIKTSISLDKLIVFKDKWFKERMLKRKERQMNKANEYFKIKEPSSMGEAQLQARLKPWKALVKLLGLKKQGVVFNWTKA